MMLLNLKARKFLLWKCGKRWGPKIPTIRLMMTLVDTESIASRKHEMAIRSILEASKPRNFTTKRLRNQETSNQEAEKPRNQRNFETKKPRSFDTKKPRTKKPRNQETPKHTDSHPCTRPPSSGYTQYRP